MTPALQALVSQRAPVILDGGLATELEKLGASLHDELWSARILDRAPELIARAHGNYFEAGAQVAITATYQGTQQGLVRAGYSETLAAQLMLRAIDLATEQRALRANADELAVAASLGPYGAFLADGSEYRGAYGLDATQLEDFHRPRWELLRESAADCFACETVPCLDEAIAFTRLAKRSPHPYWITFSCRDGEHLCDGSRIDDALERVLAADAPPMAVGVNCTAPRHILPLVQAVRERLAAMDGAGGAKLKLLVYPNSGEQYDATTKTWHGPADVQRFVEAAQQWVAAGADWVGGCCRTTPLHIKALAERFLA